MGTSPHLFSSRAALLLSVLWALFASKVTPFVWLNPQELIEKMAEEEDNLKALLNSGNQRIADWALTQLHALFPMHRFLVIVMEPSVSNGFGHPLEAQFFSIKGRKAVALLYNWAEGDYSGERECQMNLTQFFQGCQPRRDELIDYLLFACSPDAGASLRLLIGGQEEPGIAHSIPSYALKWEKVGCEETQQNGRKVAQKWHVIATLEQKYDTALLRTVRTGNNCSSLDLGLQPHSAQRANNVLLPAVLLGVILVLLAALLFTLSVVCQAARTSTRGGAVRGASFFMQIQAHCFLFSRPETELNCTQIDVERLIYTGPNSRVYFGRFRADETRFRKVAIKVPSVDAFKMHGIEQEIAINARLKHERIVEYVGFYRDAFDDIRIVNEFMDGGDLHSFVSNFKNPLTVGLVFNFVGQIAEGMQYLIRRQIIHRDLAARNCMLNADCTQVKIADFGLSRQFAAADNTYSCSNPVRLPLRWIAIECFDDSTMDILRNCKFSEKTDVWSFGVVTWECFARGGLPYGDEKTDDFREVLQRLKADEHCRLAKPRKCPPLLYDQLLLKCWTGRPERRPDFTQVRHILRELFDNIMGADPDVLAEKI